jgi:hypothetical protein
MDLGSNFRMLLDKMHYRPKKKGLHVRKSLDTESK